VKQPVFVITALGKFVDWLFSFGYNEGTTSPQGARVFSAAGGRV
jgi:hypothetical protein